MIIKELGSGYMDKVILEMPADLWRNIYKVSTKLFPLKNEFMGAGYNVKAHEEIGLIRFDAFADLMHSLSRLTPLELVAFLKDFTNYAEYFIKDREDVAFVLKRILEK